MATTPKIGEYDVTLLSLATGNNTLKATAIAPTLKLAESDKGELSEKVSQGELDIRPNGAGYIVCGLGTMRGAIEINKWHIDGYITEIADSAFANEPGLTGVTIPNTVKKIGKSAFENSGITYVTFEDTDEIVIFFKNTPGWLDPYINYTLESTGGDVWHRARWGTNFQQNIYSFSVPLDVMDVYFTDETGAHMTNTVDVGSIRGEGSASNLMVEPSGRDASGNFNCTLEYFFNPGTTFDSHNGLTIGNSAFKSCTRLGEVLIPRRTTSIDISAFQGCENLIKVNYAPYSRLTQIPSNAFRYCSNLEATGLPYSIDRISSYAFYGCSKLKALLIPNTVIYIENNAFQDSGLIAFSFGAPDFLPIRLKSIGAEAFMNCTGLAERYTTDNPIHIPASVEFIGDGAFSGTINEYVNELGYTVMARPWLEFDDKYTWFKHDRMPFNHAIAAGTAEFIPPERMDWPGVIDPFFTDRGFHYTKLKKMFPPTLSLDGNTLIIEDKLGLAEKFCIYVNENTIPAITVNPKAMS